MNLILIGMPGSGKSSAAALLAARLSFKVADTDELIEKSYGKISDIFSKYGEARFRLTESRVIKSLAGSKNTVIATGGGSVLNPANVKIFKSLGKTVYLKAEASTLLKRLEGDVSRPLLAGGKEKLLAMYSERRSIYEAAADISVETDGLTLNEAVNKIMESIK